MIKIERLHAMWVRANDQINAAINQPTGELPMFVSDFNNRDGYKRAPWGWCVCDHALERRAGSARRIACGTRGA